MSDFLAERSVDALFLALGESEKELRKEYKAMEDAVVTKVFDYYNKRKKS